VEATQTTVRVLQRQQALAIKVSILSQRLTALTMAIERVEVEITKLFKKLPYNPKDFPVGNITSLTALISEIEDIHRFPSLKQFLSHFGWCPKSFQTGNYRREHPRMSHTGNKYVRRLIWMFSIVSVRIVPRYRAYFQRHLAKGKAKMHIIVALGRKLPSVIYAILKKGSPYSPNWEANHYLALARN